VEKRTLTLAQQEIVLRKPTDIDIEEDTVTVIEKARREHLNGKPRPFQPGGQFNCDCCKTNVCLCLNTNCLPIRWITEHNESVTDVDHAALAASLMAGGSVADDPLSSSVECLDVSQCPCPVRLADGSPCPVAHGQNCPCTLHAVRGNPCSVCTLDVYAPEWPNTLDRVICLLGLDLDALNITDEHRAEVRMSLARFDLVSSPHIYWRPQRVLTIRQQHLMACHLTEIGVSQRIAEGLEDHATVCVLNDLLQMDWSQIVAFTESEEDGGIPNFGRKSLDEIRRCLTEHGFNAPPETEWILEQDTNAYHIQEMARFFPKQVKPS